jgi:hypothetical protein
MIVVSQQHMSLLIKDLHLLLNKMFGFATTFTLFGAERHVAEIRQTYKIGIVVKYLFLIYDAIRSFDYK